MECFRAGVLLINTEMGDINIDVNNHPKAGGNRMVKRYLKIDMTPMVDLGFLLISFFVITTELARPTVMDLYMPKEGGSPTTLGESNALTLLLNNDQLYYYKGKWEDASNKKAILPTSFPGLRKIITGQQEQLDIIAKNKEGRNGLMLLIKPGDAASYKNIVDVLDEATICMVKKYAIVKLSDQEKTWLKGN
jgi:biopolymer transport protein ExbD